MQSVLLVALLLAVAAAQTCDPATTNCDHVCDRSAFAFSSSQLGGQYVLYWTVEGDTLHFCAQVQAASVGYVGFGISTPGQKMTNADLMIGRMVDGFWRVEDMFSGSTELSSIQTDVSRGGLDSLTNKGGGRVGGVAALRFSRKLDTGDASDRPISTTAPTEVIFAFASSGADALSYHGPTRGIASINFHQGTRAPPVPSICPAPSDPGLPHSWRVVQLKFDWPAANFDNFPCGNTLSALARYLAIDGWRIQVLNAGPATGVSMQVQLGDFINPPAPTPLTGDAVEQTLRDAVAAGSVNANVLGANVNLVEFTDSQGRLFTAPPGSGTNGGGAGGGGLSHPLLIAIIVVACVLVILIVLLIVCCARAKRQDESARGSLGFMPLYEPRPESRQRAPSNSYSPLTHEPLPSPRQPTPPRGSVVRMFVTHSYVGNPADSTLSVVAGQAVTVTASDAAQMSGSSWTWAKNRAGEEGYVATGFLKKPSAAPSLY